jgi:hypothetical protein
MLKEQKEQLTTDLRECIVDVEFKKKSDGTIRELQCTQNWEALEENGWIDSLEDIDKSNKKTNPDVCVVFSMIEEGWRSFRWDSVISWTVYRPKRIVVK